MNSLHRLGLTQHLDGANVIWNAANSATQQAVTGVTDQNWVVIP